MNSEYSAEFIRHARLARLNVGPSNEHLGRCLSTTCTVVRDQPITTPVYRRMLQLKHDRVVGHIPVDRNALQRLDDSALGVEECKLNVSPRRPPL